MSALDDLTPASVQWIEYTVRPSLAQLRAEREATDAEFRRLAGTTPHCAPWCAYHFTDWSPGSTGVCYSDPQSTDADVVLSDEHEGQWKHQLQWKGGESVSLEAAEAHARKVLALVELARATDGSEA